MSNTLIDKFSFSNVLQAQMCIDIMFHGVKFILVAEGFLAVEIIELIKFLFREYLYFVPQPYFSAVPLCLNASVTPRFRNTGLQVFVRMFYPSEQLYTQHGQN